MNRLYSELEELRIALAVMEEENYRLSERAEDAMLLAQVTEAIEQVSEPTEMVERLLERVSILKDLPFVGCGHLTNNRAELVVAYCAFCDKPLTGIPIALETEIIQELQLGPYLTSDLAGLDEAVSLDFKPGAVLLIPFNCHYFERCIFLACCHQGEQGRLARMGFLLDQVVRIVKSRLDNRFLTRQLEEFNSQLEERVLEKTRDLQKAHTELERSHARLLTILHGIDNYIHVTDTRTYRLLFCNETAKRLFGHDIEGKECFRALRKLEHPCEFCRIPQLLATSEDRSRSVSWESHNPMTGRWFLNDERIIDWPDAPQSLLTVGADVTKIKIAEGEKQHLARKLHQAQKVEAIGVLAGSIAHDLNNILCGVVSYPDLLLATLPGDSPLRKGLTTIQTAGTKAAKLVQGMLTLSRRRIKLDEPVELHRLVEEYLESAECLDLLKKHPLVRIIGPAVGEPLAVMGSSAHLANVLMNLVINAAEAMVGGGTVTIGLRQELLPRQPPGFMAWRNGLYARLSVSDTGIGIQPEHVGQVFDPFFSRKPQGVSGTGLGLAVVWGTVIDHQGHVEIQTCAGRGTTFHILLPLADSTIDAGKQPGDNLLRRGRGESVMVVDDDPDQRRIAAEALTFLGYEALTAASGEDALQVLYSRKADLVLLDMLMAPGMDGLETYRRIHHLRPEQQVIIVSGDAHSEKVKLAMDLGAGGFLQKPYTIAKFSATVANLLADPTERHKSP